MQRLTVLSAVVTLSCAAFAQQVTAPSIFANAEGGTTGNVWRAGINRVQCFYDSTNFSSQGTNLPIEINNLEFRLAGGGTTNIVTYPNVEIYLQYSAVNFQTPSTTFANNRTVAFPTTPNFSGPITTLPVSGTTPNDFFINVPLATPFVYDPSTGQDLLMEIVILAAPAPVLGNTISAGFSNPAHLCNSIRSVGSTTATTGSASAFAPVTRFGYAPVPGAAFNETLGQGCLLGYASIYESFSSSAAFDLANTGLTFTAAGGGYVVGQGGTLIPLNSIGAATQLALTDDSEVNVPFTIGSFPGWTGLQVCSNGFVSQGAGNGTSAGPAATALLAAPATAFYSWHDFDPATDPTSGKIWVEESATVTTVTWDGVFDFGTTAANTLQFQFYANGDVVIVWGAMSGLGNGHLVGYSPGGPSLNPGNTDLSALTGPIVLQAADQIPLSLAATSRPITGTNWQLEVRDIPATGVIGIEIVGISDPGINDLAFLGMPGCGLRASLDSINGWLPTGPTHTFSLAIPANATLLGVEVFSASAMYTLPALNLFGAITSNGIKGTVGTL